MRLLSITYFTILFFSCNNPGSVNTKKQISSQAAAAIHSIVLMDSSSAEEEVIKEITTEYDRINKLMLKVDSFKCDSAGCIDNGIVKYYTHNNQIVKVVEEGVIGDGSWCTEYYYKKESFIYSYEIMKGGPAIGPITTLEKKIYVKNNIVVRYLENQKNIESDRRIVNSTEKEYALLKAYNDKNFLVALCK